MMVEEVVSKLSHQVMISAMKTVRFAIIYSLHVSSNNHHDSTATSSST
jgi:hypothetical protein